MTPNPSLAIPWTQQQLYVWIGQVIRGARELRGLSQRDLAARLHTHANTVSRWETATYRPSLADLYQVADVLGIDVRLLLPDDVRVV